MDARSLAALNRTAASPPRLLSRNAAALEGAAVTLYVFRVPGRRDLCLTPSKPLGDVVTDLDVSTALYYVRFDEDPPAARMTLLRRNPATNSTQEVALVVEPAAHIDVFAVEYGRIEERFWRMNGNEVLTIKSNFGCTVHHADSSYYFLSPWTGRCTFLPVKSGHALRCSHTLRIPTEESVDISELRFNFSGHRIKNTYNPLESSRLSEQTAAESSFSSFLQSSHHRTSTDFASKRRSIFSRTSDHIAAGGSEEHSSKRRSFLLPIHKRLHTRSSSIDDNAVPPATSVSSLEQLQSQEEYLPAGQTGPVIRRGAQRESLLTVVEGRSSSSAFHLPNEMPQYATSNPSESDLMPPQLPPRQLFGPRPLVAPAAGSSIASESSGKPSVSVAIPRRPVRSGSEDSPSDSQAVESADAAADAAMRKTSIKRKAIGSGGPVQANSPVDLAVKNVVEALIPEEQSTERSLEPRGEPEEAANQPRSQFTEDVAPPLPPRRPVGAGDSRGYQDATRSGLDDQLHTSGSMRQPQMTLDENTTPQPGSHSQSKETSKLDLSLGQEKLGGGSDGEQAKLAKLIVWSEGQKMLDLIVAANVLMFCRAYEAANMPGKET